MRGTQEHGPAGDPGCLVSSINFCLRQKHLALSGSGRPLRAGPPLGTYLRRQTTRGDPAQLGLAREHLRSLGARKLRVPNFILYSSNANHRPDADLPVRIFFGLCPLGILGPLRSFLRTPFLLPAAFRFPASVSFPSSQKPPLCALRHRYPPVVVLQQIRPLQEVVSRKQSAIPDSATRNSPSSPIRRSFHPGARHRESLRSRASAATTWPRESRQLGGTRLHSTPKPAR